MGIKEKRNIFIVILIVLGLLGVAAIFSQLTIKQAKVILPVKRESTPKTPQDRETFGYSVFKDTDGSVFFVGKISKILANFLGIKHPEENIEISFFLANNIEVLRFNRTIATNSSWAIKESSASLKLAAPVRVDINPMIDGEKYDKKRPLPAIKVTILE